MQQKRRGLILALLAVSAVAAAPICALAKGRTGSARIGGTNSHGKGSHYVGGRSSGAPKPARAPRKPAIRKK